MNADKWVNDRLASLDPGSNWKPDAAKALAKLRQRERTPVSVWRRWFWAPAAVTVGLAALLLTPTNGTCAPGMSCRPAVAASAPPKVEPAPALPQAPPRYVSAKPSQTPADGKAAFKQSGSASAPIVIEIYSDYECPACAGFFAETLPSLVSSYVATGKVRLVHRDFPLPMHPYARLAARYANAAGAIGSYDLAVNQIFRTQGQWSSTGAIEARLAEVVPPGDLIRVHNLVATDSHLDDTVAADVAMAAEDGINQTPAMIIVVDGKRQKVAPAPPFSVLKSYLDQRLQYQKLQ